MTDFQPRFCLVCGRVLGETVVNGHRVYLHAPMDPDDHPVIVTRADEAPQQMRMRCDFCEGEPVTHTLVVTKETSLPTAGVVYDLEWTMCETCMGFVSQDDWLNLRRHVFATYRSRYGMLSDESAMDMRVAFRDLKESMLFIYAE